MNKEHEFTTVLTGGRGIGDVVQATVLLSGQGFGVRYDLDQKTGIISNREHDLYGEPVAGRILVFTRPKGGVAASWSLAGLKERGIAPAALIFLKASPIFVQGSIFADIPLMDGFTEDPNSKLVNGEEIILFPAEGRVEARRRCQP